MCNKHKDRACETLPISSYLKKFVDNLVTQQLHDGCHNPRENSENTIDDFYEKTKQIRGDWR